MITEEIKKALLEAELAFDEAQKVALAANGGKRKRKSPRSKQQIQREQEELQEKTKSEIDQLVDEYHARLPRSKAKCIGAIYARYSSRFQSSIIDQVRELLARALTEEIFIPRELIFYDLAVRGWKDRRPGLGRLREAIDRKTFKTLLLFSTSRLYRRSYKSMEFVEESLVGRGLRAIFVSSNLDTEDGDNWRAMLQILGVVDESQVRMMAAQIHSAHIGLVERRMVCTTLSLGFTGEDVPGEQTRLKRPRQRIIIDPETAVWIVRIFRWYLSDGLCLDQIARELNDDPDAPAPVKSINQIWTHTSVRNTLTNPVYRGELTYGRTKSVWSSEKDYSQQIERDEPLKVIHFEELRIIPDQCWFEVQRLLDLEVSNSGRKSKSGDRQKRPKLLRGLLVCPDHGRRMVTGGNCGTVLICPLCRAYNREKRPLYTHLNRQLTLRLTCEAFAALFQDDNELVAKVISICQSHSDLQQSPDHEMTQRLQNRAASLQCKIAFNRRNPGESDAEHQQTLHLLRGLRQEYDEASAALSNHESALTRKFVVPTRDDVLARLDEYRQTLLDAREAENDQQLRLARRLIEELITGKILLYQQGERKQGHGWLQGRVTVNVIALLVKKLTGVSVDVEESECFELVIDYQKTMLIDEQSETAKRLWDEDLLHVEIARQMGCVASSVTKLIQHWHDKRGLPRPNNKSRRKQLENKQTKLPLYKQIANDVHKLMEKGHSNLEIARQLKTNDGNVSKAISWWHQKRGLPIPTATDRRNQKLARAMKMLDDGLLIKDIAKELDYSPRGLKLALKQYAIENGEKIPDGRTRRGNANSGNTANGKRSESNSEAA